NGDSSAPLGVRNGKELGGAPLVDPGKLGGVERGRDPRCSAIGIFLETVGRQVESFTLEEEL
ncbi:hypothetical protein Tco_1233556, partial [Tanacetum coccineum]